MAAEAEAAEDSPAVDSAVHQEVAGKMKKIIAVVMVLVLLLSGCTGKIGEEEASVGVGRKMDSTQNSW